MQLNTENGEAYELATELAKLTGESIAEAVTRALSDRVEKQKAAHAAVSERVIQERRAAAKHICELGRRFREEGSTSNHDWLYDEKNPS